MGMLAPRDRRVLGRLETRGISIPMEISPASVVLLSAPNTNGRDGTKTKALREEVLQYRQLHTPSDSRLAPPSTLAKTQPAGLGSLHLPSCLRCLTFELPPRLLSSGLLSGWLHTRGSARGKRGEPGRGAGTAQLPTPSANPCCFPPVPVVAVPAERGCSM